MGERSRKAEKERNKKLTPQEKEDLEKFYTGEFAKENDLLPSAKSENFAEQTKKVSVTRSQKEKFSTKTGLALRRLTIV